MSCRLRYNVPNIPLIRHMLFRQRPAVDGDVVVLTEAGCCLPELHKFTEHSMLVIYLLSSAP